MGHLVYPMLFLNRDPVPSDAQGWDRVLVFVDGNGTINVFPSVINLNEENNYFQSLSIQGEGKWSISGVVDEFIRLDSSSGQLEGIGNARIDITKAPTLVAQGSYSCSLFITLANADGTEFRIPVYITVNVPLTVNNRGNGETLTINLNAANNYTQTLTIIRDREWILENVDASRISVTPTSGNGADLPNFSGTLTVTKSPSLLPALTVTNTSTTFQVVSLYQRVNVTVNITIPAVVITGEFVDPRPGEAGVIGTGNVYVYF
jgi:hypothetical protein